MRSLRGDAEAMRDLRPLLERLDDWEQVLDSPAGFARRMVAAAGLKRSLLLREAWDRHAARVQADLEGEHPSPLERALCERVATCWLDVCLAQLAVGLAHQPLEHVAGLRFARALRQEERVRLVHDSAEPLDLITAVPLLRRE